MVVLRPVRDIAVAGMDRILFLQEKVFAPVTVFRRVPDIAEAGRV